jgi:hypothetical protein
MTVGTIRFLFSLILNAPCVHVAFPMEPYMNRGAILLTCALIARRPTLKPKAEQLRLVCLVVSLPGRLLERRWHRATTTPRLQSILQQRQSMPRLRVTGFGESRCGMAIVGFGRAPEFATNRAMLPDRWLNYPCAATPPRPPWPR